MAKGKRKEPKRRPIPEGKLKAPARPERTSPDSGEPIGDPFDAWLAAAITRSLSARDGFDRNAASWADLHDVGNLTEQVTDTLKRFEWLVHHASRMKAGPKRDVVETTVQSAQSQLIQASCVWQALRWFRGYPDQGTFNSKTFDDGYFAANVGGYCPNLRLMDPANRARSVKEFASVMWTAICRASNSLAAPAFILPSDIAVELMEVDVATLTDLPELKIPFQTTNVWFDTPLIVPEEAFDARDAVGHEVAMRLRSVNTPFDGKSNMQRLGMSHGEVMKLRKQFWNFEKVQGVTFTRNRSGALSPHVTLTFLGGSVAGFEEPHALDIDLRRESVLSPALLNVAAALSLEYWKHPEIQGEVQPISPTTGYDQPAERSDPAGPGIAFYEIGMGTQPSEQQLSTGREMPEYTMPEHTRPFRVGGSGENWPGTYVIRRVAERRVNEGLRGDRVSDKTSYRMPVSSARGAWNGFTEGDVVKRGVDGAFRKVGTMERGGKMKPSGGHEIG